MDKYANEMLQLYADGVFKLELWKDGYPFSAEGLVQAHDDLVNRRTTGKLLVNIA